MSTNSTIIQSVQRSAVNLSNSTFLEVPKGTTSDALRRSPEHRLCNIYYSNLAKSKCKKPSSGNSEAIYTTIRNNGASNSFATHAIKHSKVVVTLNSLVNSNAKFTKPHIVCSTTNRCVLATEAANV